MGERRERERERWKPQCFLKSNLRSAYHYFCHILLVTQTDPGTVWERATRECKHRDAGIPGAMLEDDYHTVKFLVSTGQLLNGQKERQFSPWYFLFICFSQPYYYVGNFVNFKLPAFWPPAFPSHPRPWTLRYMNPLNFNCILTQHYTTHTLSFSFCFTCT